MIPVIAAVLAGKGAETIETIDVTVATLTVKGDVLYGFDDGTSTGAVSPGTVNGYTIEDLHEEAPTSNFIISLSGSPPDNAFSKVEIQDGAGFVELLVADASITGTTTKTWEWTTPGIDWNNDSGNNRDAIFTI